MTTVHFEGVDHVSLTVRDLATSRRWYEESLGMVTLRQVRRETFTRAILHFPGHKAVMGLTQHDGAGDDIFCEARAGLDHVAFRVASRQVLEDWCRWLDDRGTPYSGIIDDAGGSHVVLRDPDNIQLELLSPPTALNNERGRSR